MISPGTLIITPLSTNPFTHATRLHDPDACVSLLLISFDLTVPQEGTHARDRHSPITFHFPVYVAGDINPNTAGRRLDRSYSS